ncbi:B-cell receptor CD22-like [Rhinoderma darwinii]|uniref:B-cell receptor CD22-like n=1 Tax=Rhinoderma darwinii TaxID=43563 RepID=UPI003F67221E
MRGMFSWHPLGPLIPVVGRLNSRIYLSNVADQDDPFMTAVYPMAEGHFSGNYDKLSCPNGPMFLQTISSPSEIYSTMNCCRKLKPMPRVISKAAKGEAPRLYSFSVREDYKKFQGATPGLGGVHRKCITIVLTCTIKSLQDPRDRNIHASVGVQQEICVILKMSMDSYFADKSTPPALGILAFYRPIELMASINPYNVKHELGLIAPYYVHELSSVILSRGIMENVQARGVWTFVFFFFLFKGAFNKDGHVKVSSRVTAWPGSCAVLSCEFTYKDIYNYTWYYNPEFNDSIKEYVGTIVYQSTRMVEPGGSFKNKVEYIGKGDKNCSIVISDLQSNDTGDYSLRLIGNNNWKWMSQRLSLIVSDTGSSLKLHPVPYMQENQPVTLTCSIDYYCPLYDISLTWLQDVNGTVRVDIRSDMRETSTTTTLTFVPTWKDNNKNISCVLQRMNAENDSRTIQLDVKYAPQNVQIMSKDPIIKLKEGEVRTLECSVESSNPPNFKITWYRNGKIVYPEERKKKFNLSGRYHCEAENSMGKSISNTVEISVLYAPKEMSIQKPERIIEGWPVSLNCSTVANPPVSRYLWYRNSRHCFNSTDSHYNFSKITENDSGSYECRALNDQGSGTSMTVQLDVMYAPKKVNVVLKPDMKQFSEGIEVTFECVVNSSNPKVTKIEWHKNNKLVDILEKLTIQPADAGTYTCKARNEIGTSSSDEVSVEVLYLPKISACTILNGYEKKEQDQVTLKCLSQESNPKISSYEWYKSQQLYKTTNSEFLNFTNLQRTDSGHYSCKAKNTRGSSKEGYCRYLIVNYAPKNVSVIVSPGNSVIENSDVKITCAADAKPAPLRYIWYHNNEPLQKYQQNYELVDVQMSHAGEYYCEVQNNIGSNKSQAVYLHVSYSFHTIGKYTASGIGPLIAIILVVVLIFHFRICFRMKTCWKAENARSDASFFVLKKSNNELSDHLGQLTPSEDSLTEQINYTSLQFPPSTNEGQSQSRTKASCPDPNDIYSVLKKPMSTAEYENIEPSKITKDKSEDDIHYSTIANLNKSTVRVHDPEVEYAMLRH